MADITRISHIGSTSIDTIWAKPIIDILVEIKQDCSWNILKDLLLGSGYICMSETNKRLSFNKGYTVDGFAKEVFHLHLRYSGDNDELYFRDYLKEYPETAKAYENLKMDLWHKHEHNRDAYTDGKTDFVKKCTAEAKKLYRNRYT
ncbi:hypothetical protein SDC9_142873 [bioreactor metagenome]|uniref:Dephospho-CoA kinase n=1 Tax=bioreactor metagenome TaxID=1076179 RepID=A0A645E2V6_9ZZZZ